MSITDCLSVLTPHNINDLAQVLDAQCVTYSGSESTATSTISTSNIPTVIGYQIVIPVERKSILAVWGAATFSSTATDSYVYLYLMTGDQGGYIGNPVAARIPTEYSASHGKEERLEKLWVLDVGPGCYLMQPGLMKLSGTVTCKYAKISAMVFRVS